MEHEQDDESSSYYTCCSTLSPGLPSLVPRHVLRSTLDPPVRGPPADPPDMSNLLQLRSQDPSGLFLRRDPDGCSHQLSPQDVLPIGGPEVVGPTDPSIAHTVSSLHLESAYSPVLPDPIGLDFTCFVDPDFWASVATIPTPVTPSPRSAPSRLDPPISAPNHGTTDEPEQCWRFLLPKFFRRPSTIDSPDQDDSSYVPSETPSSATFAYASSTTAGADTVAAADISSLSSAQASSSSSHDSVQHPERPEALPKPSRFLKLGTYNIRSGRQSRLQLACRAMAMANMDIVVLTETKIDSDFWARSAYGYTISCTQALSPFQGGIALIHRQSSDWHIESIRHHGPNVLSCLIVQGP